MDPHQSLYEILDRRPSYPLAAYHAVHKGLSVAAKARQGSNRHVTGQELSFGMASYLRAEYGPFAKMVLDGWGIRSTSDFGRLVYNLIEAGLMKKQDSDSIHDFDNVYDLAEMFPVDGDWLEPVRSELGLPAADAATRW